MGTVDAGGTSSTNLVQLQLLHIAVAVLHLVLAAAGQGRGKGRGKGRGEGRAGGEAGRQAGRIGS